MTPRILFFVLALSLTLASCKKDSTTEPAPVPPGEAVENVVVKVAFDANNAAFQFAWKSKPKTMPSGFANVGSVYPMQFHDLLKYDGTIFNRLPEGQRMDEDRVSFMIQNPSAIVAGFSNAGCWVACHNGMASHNLVDPGVLDHWHWRGGRSGPMGYAEDAAVNEVERIRDNTGTPQSKWMRSGGDRLREDQAAIVNTSHALAEGMPRFVFNKGKTMPDGYTLPGFFLATANGTVMTDPHAQIPLIKTVDVNRSLLVIYQDLSFDPVNKVNAVDVGYLVFVANGTTAHLPAHLQTTGTADFTAWTNFWAAELGIQPTDAAAAEAKLTAINTEWEGSGRHSMVTRSVSAIYPSDQHDVTSTREFNPGTGVWTVTLFRRLSTGSNRDADLSGLGSGQSFVIGFALHDLGGGSETHNISLPYIVGTGNDADIQATAVADVKTADWSSIPAFKTKHIRDQYKWTLDVLKGTAHPGAASVGVIRCQSCHKQDGSGRVLNP